MCVWYVAWSQIADILVCSYIIYIGRERAVYVLRPPPSAQLLVPPPWALALTTKGRLLVLPPARSRPPRKTRAQQHERRLHGASVGGPASGDASLP